MLIVGTMEAMMKGFSISVLAALLSLPAAAQVFTVQPEGVAAK